MIRELTDMELDAVCGGRKRHRKSSQSIRQSVDVDQSNFAVQVAFDTDGGNISQRINQENESNNTLIAVNA